MQKAIFAGTILGLALMAAIAHAQHATYQALIRELLESNVKTRILAPGVNLLQLMRASVVATTSP